MAEHILSVTEAQREITHLREQFEKEPEAVTVTWHGKPIMAIMPFEAYKTLLGVVETLQETVEILQDEELMAAFKHGMKDIEAGKVKTWQQFKQEHNW